MERISKFLQRLPILATLLFLAGIGMLSLLFATTPGVGVTPDSVVYFDLARNISDGHGFVATNCAGKEILSEVEGLLAMTKQVVIASAAKQSLPSKISAVKY